MALTVDEVRKIASLARLRLTPEQETVFVHQLGRIVDYFDQLRSLGGDTGVGSDADPAPVHEAEDVPRPGLPRELFLANAPASAWGELLVVPEVKGGGDAADGE